MSRVGVSGPLVASGRRDLPFYPPPCALSEGGPGSLVAAFRTETARAAVLVLVVVSAAFSWGAFVCQVILIAKGSV